ncbi:MAG: undecaprenyldiphospho-muramoylpentapeptide beta-N-acetylglucosaminyltransferase [Clostridiales Family XIII bacterium]|jgi:UDP-N-acetylglucosamine--N-acetylmuramyl-(pentapeptide) pyrophosphoryl-undecaprenol N-acetylglucosamine transferase|nr:undecaprenyldiphospho-muramoylpentapeptide beta-N-acetylglucosaminyltransferase [Clostridiales Family XIII bacterium]
MKFLLASSATGGHLYPALAVADRIRARDAGAGILFVGGAEDIGRDLVGEAGYPVARIDAHGLDRRNAFKALISLMHFLRAARQARHILRSFEPDAVLGTGGYVVAPVAREAKRLGIRVYLQEQNVLPGLANRISERYADKVFLGFAEAAPAFKDRAKLVYTGNPIRTAIFSAPAARAALRGRFGIPESDRAVLLFGGSQGADAVNAAGVEAICALSRYEGLHFFFVTGQRMYGEVAGEIAHRLGVIPARIHVIPYADAIWEYYAACDLIAARAGALTVSEIAACGKPSILLPSPNVTNDHQYYNAKALADVGAAVIMRDEEMAGGGLARGIEGLLRDEARLEQMGVAAARAAKPGAAEEIADGLFGTGPS